ncbi:hypothetical protein L1987_74591 [Smallanthus sonchifolius]|uniref:Uncharacterized protein n=1 Tax=Smallanthus sonchifolius TaxID=185202 RepID=A0ACB9A4P4_9ASTR|nr:hypothetical protein L1987_74591 [Smallanthus sonchifolius]
MFVKRIMILIRLLHPSLSRNIWKGNCERNTKLSKLSPGVEDTGIAFRPVEGLQYDKEAVIRVRSLTWRSLCVDSHRS